MSADRRRRSASVRILPVVVLGFAGALAAPYAGCSDSSGNPDLLPPGPVSLNFQQINDKVLQQQCTNFSGCHNDNAIAANKANRLSFCTAPNDMYCKDGSSLRKVYDSLVNQLAVCQQAHDEGKQLVVPCDPDASFLMLKITGGPGTTNDDNVGYGKPMPRDTVGGVPAVYIKAIREWIARGARFDEPEGTTGTTCAADDLSVVVPADMAAPPDQAMPDFDTVD